MLDKKKIATGILSLGILMSGGTTAFASPNDMSSVSFATLKESVQEIPELVKILEEAEQVESNPYLTGEEKREAILKLANQAKKGPSKTKEE